MRPSIAAALLPPLLLCAPACKTTAGKVLGPLSVTAAVAGNGLVFASRGERAGESDARTAVGLGLICVATYALLGWTIAETRSTAIAYGGAGAPEAAAAPPPPAARGRRATSFHDRTGAYAGRLEADGSLYDRTGAYAGRSDAQGNHYDRTGALAGRSDAQGNHYDRTGALAGRSDAQGTYYDRTGATAGRIAPDGTIYDRTGAYAGRVDASCDDECRRTTTGRILLK